MLLLSLSLLLLLEQNPLPSARVPCFAEQPGPTKCCSRDLSCSVSLPVRVVQQGAGSSRQHSPPPRLNEALRGQAGMRGRVARGARSLPAPGETADGLDTGPMVCRRPRWKRTTVLCLAPPFMCPVAPDCCSGPCEQLQQDAINQRLLYL